MIPAVYNYFAANYVPKPPGTPGTVHKRSELRNLYNNIVRMNKVSPLYKINLTEDNQAFAIGIKSGSVHLAETLSALDSGKEDSIFIHKKAYAQNSSSAEVFLVTSEPEEYPAPFELEVISLAEKQVNTSTAVPAQNTNPKEGNYSFSVALDGSTYKFQYKIRENATNEETLEKLARFLNKSGLGLEASVSHLPENTVQMELSSINTGSAGEPIFTMKDLSSPENSPGLVEYYGLDQITNFPQNAVFKINGEDQETSSNSILLDKMLQINFISPSTEPFEVSYIPDSKKILEELKVFQKEYNYLIDLANNYNSKQGTPQKLLRQLSSASYPYVNDLEAAGISFDLDGQMIIDDSLASQAIESSEMNSLFTSKGFLPRLKEQLTSITMNPMNYVDKTLVTYPNISKPRISSIYVSSMYSGLFFNYYC